MPRLHRRRRGGASQRLTSSLIERCGIELNAEVACMTVRGNSYVRISAHMYNEVDQYEALVGITRLLP